MMQHVKVGQTWQRKEPGGNVMRFTIVNIPNTPNLNAIRATCMPLKNKSRRFYVAVGDLLAGKAGYSFVGDKEEAG